MDLTYRHRIEKIMDQFERGEISRQQAVHALSDIPENPGFKGT